MTKKSRKPWELFLQLFGGVAGAVVAFVLSKQSKGDESLPHTAVVSHFFTFTGNLIAPLFTLASVALCLVVVYLLIKIIDIFDFHDFFDLFN
jgi:hypothetical protein